MGSTLSNTEDKAGKDYWNENWSALKLPPLIDPDNPSLKNENSRRFHAFFKKVFSGNSTAGKRLLEVGCARSVWLPYFGLRHRFEIWGLDYSEEGCRQEEAILRAAGVEGNIVNADLFQPDPALLGAFDYVVTFGVIEHFSDTTVCIQALTMYLRPGGVLITIVPNMYGALGALQRLLDRKVFDTHVRLTENNVAVAHTNAGLSVISCDYFISTDFYVVNVAKRRHSPLYGALRLIYGILGRLSMAVWMLERVTGEFPVSRLLSPYVICVAENRK